MWYQLGLGTSPGEQRCAGVSFSRQTRCLCLGSKRTRARRGGGTNYIREVDDAQQQAGFFVHPVSRVTLRLRRSLYAFVGRRLSLSHPSSFCPCGLCILNLEPAPPDDLRLLAAPLKLIAIQKAERTP